MSLEGSKSPLNTGSVGNFQLESTQDSFSSIENDLKDLIKPYNLNQEKFGEILISLTEAITNAVRHGNKYDASKLVDVEFVGNASRLYFKISDEGSGFDVEDIPDPTQAENLLACGGRGVYIMRALADGCSFKNNGSTVELEFDIDSI